ncbi:MAG: hypothetical protein CTY16_08145 [Methylobacter sp.]|nr:MAG: hypothetical protein CTY16_08145 [Methylobacter sp.]
MAYRKGVVRHNRSRKDVGSRRHWRSRDFYRLFRQDGSEQAFAKIATLLFLSNKSTQAFKRVMKFTKSK